MRETITEFFVVGMAAPWFGKLGGRALTYGGKLRRNGATIKGSFRPDGSPTHLLRLPGAGRTTRHGAPRTS